jgi:hypothetical protein
MSNFQRSVKPFIHDSNYLQKIVKRVNIQDIRQDPITRLSHLKTRLDPSLPVHDTLAALLHKSASTSAGHTSYEEVIAKEIY